MDYGAWVGYAALAYGKRLEKGKKLNKSGHSWDFLGL